MKKEREKTSRIVAAERIIIVEYFHPRVRMQRENDHCGIVVGLVKGEN